MNGEFSLNGIYVPSLLVFGIIASLCTIVLIRLFNRFGIYRFVAYRALVDFALYVIVFGAVAFLAPHFGFAP
ncbi:MULTISPECIES: DUF1656 domain-containing protein [Novosphingobium]|uniref:DUF1656 domain-containing protein n=2 Tax=Novosphingobium TaxID=165696 RepID=A0ABT0AC13_9SPHN|nr:MULTISPECIES: DUF1656 domain-containing protein [Novosphingobium]MCJ1960732.1 DUF1656 domain-containing protein [Novosphingobium mangrovi (ex Hu et al. 2023)]MED5546020.1 DUF1656 domain-containing protein [Pseudomonadota bacterium]QVM83158.1 DUF1656 domain-containing protein [Novosphingobium decolorationis]GAM06038.1 hypothetical conserved protein [Novosphingobium sp. MBES04]